LTVRVAAGDVTDRIEVTTTVFNCDSTDCTVVKGTNDDIKTLWISVNVSKSVIIVVNVGMVRMLVSIMETTCVMISKLVVSTISDGMVIVLVSTENCVSVTMEVMISVLVKASLVNVLIDVNVRVEDKVSTSVLMTEDTSRRQALERISSANPVKPVGVEVACLFTKRALLNDASDRLTIIVIVSEICVFTVWSISDEIVITGVMVAKLDIVVVSKIAVVV